MQTRMDRPRIRPATKPRRPVAWRRQGGWECLRHRTSLRSPHPPQSSVWRPTGAKRQGTVWHGVARCGTAEHGRRSHPPHKTKQAGVGGSENKLPTMSPVTQVSDRLSGWPWMTAGQASCTPCSFSITVMVYRPEAWSARGVGSGARVRLGPPPLYLQIPVRNAMLHRVAHAVKQVFTHTRTHIKHTHTHTH
jgi:hypothetical protein